MKDLSIPLLVLKDQAEKYAKEIRHLESQLKGVEKAIERATAKYEATMEALKALEPEQTP